MAFEIAISITGPPMVGRDHDRWQEVGTAIYRNNSERLRTLLPQSGFLCREALARGDVSLKDILVWHGVGALFCAIPGPGNTWGYGSIGDWLVDVTLCGIKNASIYRDRKSYLAEAAQVLESTPLPWLRLAEAGSYLIDSGPPCSTDESVSKYASPEDLLALGSEALFGLLAYTAVQMEIEAEGASSATRGKWHQYVAQQGLPLCSLLGRTLLGRWAEPDMAVISAELQRCGFSDSKKEMIWAWVRQEVDLVAL